MNTSREEVSTGKKIQEPSDNPVNYSKSARFRNTINKNQQYLSTLESSIGWIQTSTEVLDQMADRLLDAKDIATRAADLSTNDDSSRATMSDQVDDIIEEMVSLGNSTHLDKYLFAGNNTKGQKPFYYNGNTVQYGGNDKKLYRKAAENFNVAINIEGSQFMEHDIFASLENLKNALDNGNKQGINESIGNLKDSADQVAAMNTAMGSLHNQLSTTKHRLETTNLNLKSYLSNNEDADMAEAITQYNAQETAYKAALQATSDALSLNILNFIR